MSSHRVYQNGQNPGSSAGMNGFVTDEGNVDIPDR
jgi:hypothetical protein